MISGTKSVYTGRKLRRICLVLDCLTPNDFTSRTQHLINLQHHVIREKKLNEREALSIFYHVVCVVNRLHEKNVIHRDLKLGNIVLDLRSRKVTLTNFCLGKHLMNNSDLLKDQRGSPAYISPDVLSGKPYAGKPSDMWALGVVLFTMLYGQFPFYDNAPHELFQSKCFNILYFIFLSLAYPSEKYSRINYLQICLKDIFFFIVKFVERISKDGCRL